MICMPIKLVDRRDITKRQGKDMKLEERVLLSDEFHRYEFRFDKPIKPSKEPNPVVTEINLLFPENHKGLNPRSSYSRWTHKRPRLKSMSDQKSSTRKSSLDTVRTDDEKESSIVEEKKIECTIQVIEAADVIEDDNDEEIDPDIQKLLQETEKAALETERETKERHKRKKKKRSSKKSDQNTEEKSKSRSKKITKTVSVSLSKPPSPQTLQVIRVDVTSNYSYEPEVQENISDTASEIKCGGSIKSCDNYVTSETQEKELELKCIKVTLSERC